MAQEKERIGEKDLALNDDADRARSYDVKVDPEVTALLRNKFKLDDSEDLRAEDRYPLAGIVGGVRSNTHVITAHSTGPKATVGGNEVMPFPQERIKKIAGEMTNQIISKNKVLFGEEILADKHQPTMEEIASNLEECIYDLAEFDANDFELMEFGVESWTSDIPLPQEQMEGVERRREFMLDVAEEVYRGLMKNEAFSNFLRENKAAIDFSYEIGGIGNSSIYIWIVKNEDESTPESIAQITEDHEAIVSRKLS